MKEYIYRDISPVLKEACSQYSIVTLTGPRQSGKSTLLRHLFPSYQYVSLEDLDIRTFAKNDPRGFIKTYPAHTIIDEAQKVPELFSYLQTYTDSVDEPGMYLLSGSHNFLLMQSIEQSLAGRTAVLQLLPFSRIELKKAGKMPESIFEQILKGFYPRLYDRAIPPARYYADYLKTYVERDVREILRVTDLDKFVKFLKMCAARIGQILNLTSLATDCGISLPTVEGWLSILEASYICYRLKPYYNNYNKRLIKRPKLFFYDTGIACHLLGLRKEEEVRNSYMRGELFENIVINQFIKEDLNHGEDPELYFWRDSQGNEVDLLDASGEGLKAYEIKSSSTFNPDFFNGLKKWGDLSGTPVERLNVVYNGENNLKTSAGNLLSFDKIFE